MFKAPKDMIAQWVKSGLSQHDLFCAAISNIAAGSDTISATLQAFFYYILKNRRHFIQLQEELDSAQACDKLSQFITFDETENLPFLQACVSI